VSDLLLQHVSAAKPTAAYTAFAESSVTIPTEPLGLPAALGGRAATRAATPSFKERLWKIRPSHRDRTKLEMNDAGAIADLDVAFMRDQLAGYEAASERAPYHTIELSGSRLGRHAASRHDVHIYEMHWADLSRVGSGWLRVLGALYQLVVHLAHIGRKTIDLAASAAAFGKASPVEVERWKRLASAHAWVVRLFTVAVPTSTLLLLASLMLFLPDAVPVERRLLVASIVLAVSLCFLLGARSYFSDRGPRAAARLLFSLFAVVLVAVALNTVVVARFNTTAIGTVLLGVTATLIVVAAYVGIVNVYDRSAPGALQWGLFGLIVALAGTLGFAPRFLQSGDPQAHEGLRMVALAGFQFSRVVGIVAWAMVWVAALVTGIRAWQLKRVVAEASPRPHETRMRARRAMWTAKVTAAVTLFGFILTLLVGYQAATVLAWRTHKSVNIFPSIREGASFPLVARGLVPPGTTCPARLPTEPYDPASCAKRFFEALVAQSGTAGLPVAFGTAALSLFLVSWFFILIGITSVRKPKSSGTFARTLGQWITDGFVWLRLSGSVLVFGLSVAVMLGFFAAFWSIARGAPPPFLSALSTDTTGRLLNWLALAALAGAATAAAARVRLELVTSRARPAIGIALDVDNYLRESPIEGTPRARIAERFVSLLRHVTARKDENGQPFFDRLVIVAHSQGTVITADLLRFLTVARIPSPDLSHFDVRLITMGSPLRQLYAVHFPHLYDWIDRSDDHGDSREVNDDTRFCERKITAPSLIPDDPAGLLSLTELSPSPLWLRVKTWVNLYTSGDYVGRSLWRTDNDGGVWDYEAADQAATGAGRRERCLGDGTHTRYWTSAEVARELDALISAP
jgi:FtsH-binding integral membrane protein